MGTDIQSVSSPDFSRLADEHLAKSEGRFQLGDLYWRETVEHLATIAMLYPDIFERMVVAAQTETPWTREFQEIIGHKRVTWTKGQIPGAQYFDDYSKAVLFDLKSRQNVGRAGLQVTSEDHDS